MAWNLSYWKNYNLIANKREAKTRTTELKTVPALLQQPKLSVKKLKRALSGNLHSRSKHLRFCPSWIAGPSMEMNSGGQCWMKSCPPHAFDMSIVTVSVFTGAQVTSPCCCGGLVPFCLMIQTAQKLINKRNDFINEAHWRNKKETKEIH